MKLLDHLLAACIKESFCKVFSCGDRASIGYKGPLSESVEKPSLLCERICLQSCFKKGTMFEPCPVN